MTLAASKSGLSGTIQANPNVNTENLKDDLQRLSSKVDILWQIKSES